jgi:uncharacterized tellurite resistance protein B-like protein
MENVKAVAGYSMLMLLASADGKVSPGECQRINEFVKNNFDVAPAIENSFLGDISKEDHHEQFCREAEAFLEHSTPEERDHFLQYAITLAHADQDLNKKENTFLAELYRCWKVPVNTAE